MMMMEMIMEMVMMMMMMMMFNIHYCIYHLSKLLHIHTYRQYYHLIRHLDVTIQYYNPTSFI